MKMRGKCFFLRYLHLSILLLVLCIIFFSTACTYNSTNSIFVITKSENDDSIHYYEITDNKLRKAKEFNAGESKIYYVENAFTSYIQDNKVFNTLTLDDCNVIDVNGNIIEISDELTAIITRVSELQHSILKTKIIKENETYYVILALNVNLWSPYVLYVYNFQDNDLKHLYTFDGEDILDIKH